MAAKKRTFKDAAQDATRIMGEIKARQFKPVYLLSGEEPYYLDLLTKALMEGVLAPDERAFNQTVLYGQDSKPEDVATAARQYPVMAPYQVIVVKEAQTWKKLDALMPLVNHPVATTVVVLVIKGKSADKRTAFYKGVSKIGEVYESVKLSDWDVVPWVEKYCKSKQIEIEDRAVALLADHIGADIQNLINALQKLEAHSQEHGRVTFDHVATHIGVSKDFNVFELNKAVGQRNHRKALLIANYFANNQKEHHLIPTVAALFGYFKKIAIYQDSPEKGNNMALARSLGVSPYFVKEYQEAARHYSVPQLVEAIDILHDIDLKSKGVNNSGGNSGELMRELVARLLRV